MCMCACACVHAHTCLCVCMHVYNINKYVIINEYTAIVIRCEIQSPVKHNMNDATEAPLYNINAYNIQYTEMLPEFLQILH